MIFKYSGFDKSGNKVKARIEATDLNEVKKKLKSRGIIYDSIKESGDSLFNKFNFKRKHVLSAKHLASLSRNIAIYLKSGIPIVNVIRLAKTQYEKDPVLVDFLTSLETSMDEGKSYYVALETQEIIELPAFYKQSIKVAEESGSLSEVLFEMARFVEEGDKVESKVKQALIYPGFIVIISVLMVAFMLTTVVPKITGMFTQLKQELPGVTKAVIAMGDFLGAYWLAIAIFVIVSSSIFGYLVRTSESFKFAYHKFLLKAPLFGNIIQTFELARFSYITSVLIRSGVTFVHAVKLAGGILDNVAIRAQFQAAVKDLVEGKKFSTSLAKHGKNIDKSFTQAIALGEETSEVAMVMENLAELYFEENRNKIDLFLSLMEPVLILFVGAMIGFIVVAMLLPIFSMNLGAM
ncbi:MAG TPA: type II secretion system F family protein [Campylobacterales bacterium]|nr:type II secretion system F family protein [Campylobacterales bacterium]HIP59387.1 type II secretion system F family protein [Campylobacterales bacterium]